MTAQGNRRLPASLAVAMPILLWCAPQASGLSNLAVTSGTEFDLADTSGSRTGGFGCFAWARMKAATAEFDNLGIKYVRLTRDDDSWSDLQAFRAYCSARGIKWVYTLWNAPQAYRDGANLLKDPAGFAKYWKDQVAELDAHQCRPEFVDLMNEPDSKGVWSTGISPADMNTLIKTLRQELDLAGFAKVGIAAPNLTSMSDWSGPQAYFQAMDQGAVGSLAAFATHPWGDDVARSDCSGGADCLAKTWPGFGLTAKAKDPAKPLWILEYATRQYTYDGTVYPDPDKVGQYNASFSMPYAVRTFENTLAFLNLGATIPFYWDAGDDPGSSKQWGYLDEKGAKKPVYEILKALYPHIPVGSRVLKAGSQDSALYAGAYLSDSGVTLGIANDSKSDRQLDLRLIHAGSPLAFQQGIAVEISQRGDPAKKQPDQCRVVPVTLPLTKVGEGSYSLHVSLAGYSTLTVLLKSTPVSGILAGPSPSGADAALAATASRAGAEPVYDAAGRQAPLRGSSFRIRRGLREKLGNLP